MSHPNPINTTRTASPDSKGPALAARRETPTAPPIVVRDCDVSHLLAAAFDGLVSCPRVAGGLLEEVERATKVSDRHQWTGVVVLGSRVLYREDSSPPRWTFLVKPGDADGANAGLSVLTTIGAGLLGLAKGQSILWDDRLGGKVRLEIINVIDPGDEGAEC